MSTQINFKIALVSLVALLSLQLFSQDTSSADKKHTREYAENAFTGTQLINSQTTKIQYPKSWYFEIQHRFGKIGLDSSLPQQFLGLDLPSVMRLAVGAGINERFYFEIGRTNHLKTVDIEAKYLLLRQTTDFRIPVSVALYFNSAIRTERFPNVPKNAYFEDTITPFYYKPAHRFAYTSQIIISSKLSDKISLQLTPVLVYQNLVNPGYDNYTLTLSAGGRYKFGINSSLIFEYAHVFNNRFNSFQDPFSLGVEFGTAGHVFQVFMSTSTRILESHIYTSSAANIGAGEFLIGFNIQRNFWRK